MRIRLKAMNGAILVTDVESFDTSEADTSATVYVFLKDIHKDWFLNNILTNRTVQMTAILDQGTREHEHLVYIPEVYHYAQDELIGIVMQKGYIQ